MKPVFWIDRRIEKLHLHLYLHPHKGSDDPDYLNKVKVWEDLKATRQALREKRLLLDSILVHKINADSGKSV
jgi:hypothetical protein